MKQPRLNRMIKHNLLLVLLLSLCTACGYHVGHGGIASNYTSISVPYAAGDWDGDLTSAIIKEIAQQGTLTYCPCGGDLTLNVAILDYREDEISFRYEPKRDSCKLRKSLIPDENRVYAFVEVSVVEAISCTTVMGPVRFSAFVEYDHDYYAVRDAVNVFSLGQLTDIDSARDSVQKPLNRQIAKKVVAYLNDNW